MGIFNELCPYVLLALGRGSIEKGIQITMPAWGKDGYFEFQNGARVTMVNRYVYVIRPLGYKLNPDKGPAFAAVDIATLGIPAQGDFSLYIGSGEPHPGDIKSHLKPAIFTVCIDKKHGGVAQDITRSAVGNALVAAASLERCRFVWISLNCNTYSVLHYLPDARGQPGKPYRDTDNVLGYRRSDGTLPPAVAESNLTTRVAVEVAMACASHDGAVGAETPQKRRGGPPDGMPGCEKHVHNFDHPSWQLFIEASPCSG